MMMIMMSYKSMKTEAVFTKTEKSYFFSVQHTYSKEIFIGRGTSDFLIGYETV